MLGALSGCWSALGFSAALFPCRALVAAELR